MGNTKTRHGGNKENKGDSDKNENLAKNLAKNLANGNPATSQHIPEPSEAILSVSTGMSRRVPTLMNDRMSLNGLLLPGAMHGIFHLARGKE